MEEKDTKGKASISRLLGLALMLFSLIGFLSVSFGVVNSKFAFIFAYVFAFPFLYLFGLFGFWGLLPTLLLTGILILIKKKFKTRGIGCIFLGLFIMFFGVIILFGVIKGNSLINTIGEESFNVSNCVNLFNSVFSNPDKTGAWDVRGELPIILDNKIGSGLIGYAIGGLLCSVGTWFGYVVSILVMLVGFVLTFHEPIGLIFGIARDNSSAKRDFRKEEREHFKAISETKQDEKPVSKVGGLYKDDDRVSDGMSSFASSSNDGFGTSPIYRNSAVTTAKFLLEDDEENAPTIKEKIEKPVAPIIENEFIGLDDDIVPPQHNNIEENDESIDDSVEVNNSDNVVDDELPSSFNETVEKEKNEESNVVFEQPISNPQPRIEKIEPVVEKSIEPKPIVVQPVESKPAPVAPQNEFIPEPPQPKKEVKPYILPPSSLLRDYSLHDSEIIKENELKCADRMSRINKLFANHGVDAHVETYTIGPSITCFDVEYGDDGLVSQVNKVKDDISVRLGGVPTRFVPTIYEKTCSGIEVANSKRLTVGFKECLEQMPPRDENNATMYCFGKDIYGKYLNANIAKGPHMLVAGTTGSGKTVFIHSIIFSLIMRNTPEQMKLVMVDPKKVEFVKYNDLPHLLCPVITDPMKAKVCLDKLVDEMERRFDTFAKVTASNIKAYNKKMIAENGELMPYIVCFVDEYADLSASNKDVALSISRLGAKSRACGICLVIATQHPTADVINTTIKANLPVRVGLKVNNGTESGVILGETGAECLLGNGDMLLNCGEIVTGSCLRCQGAFIDDDEMDEVIDFIKQQREVEYDPNFSNLEMEKDPNEAFEKSIARANESDEPAVPAFDRQAAAKMESEEFYKQVIQYCISKEFCSMSGIQRDFSIGFNKAGKVFNRLVQDGYVSASSSSRGSKVLKHEMGETTDQSNSNPPAESDFSEGN